MKAGRYHTQGQLKALAYDEDGKVIAVDIVSHLESCFLYLTLIKRTIELMVVIYALLKYLKRLDGFSVENANNEFASILKDLEFL